MSSWWDDNLILLYFFFNPFDEEIKLLIVSFLRWVFELFSEFDEEFLSAEELMKF